MVYCSCVLGEYCSCVLSGVFCAVLSQMLSGGLFIFDVSRQMKTELTKFFIGMLLVLYLNRWSLFNKVLEIFV